MKFQKTGHFSTKENEMSNDGEFELVGKSFKKKVNRGSSKKNRLNNSNMKHEGIQATPIGADEHSS